MKEVAAAMELFTNGDAVTARQQLLQLTKQHPHNQTILLALIEVGQQIQDWHTFADFAQSRYSSDDLRLEAVQFISQYYPAMLPEDKQVPMWINGQQTELFMLGFEITDEPEGIEGVSEETLAKYETTYDLLMDDKLEEAEVLLQEIITEAPLFHSRGLQKLLGRS